MKKIIILALLIIFNFQFLTFNCFCQWFTQNSGTTQHLYDVFFIDTSTGWACGENGTIVKTSNGGNNWFNQNSGITTSPLYSIHFVDQNIGYAVTRGNSTFIKTRNGGNNWFTIFTTPNASFESIFFIDSLKGWAAGSGWVFKTTNGGNSWDSIFISDGTGYDIKFINAETGWFAKGSGLYKSTTGGNDWFLQFNIIGYGDIKSLYFTNSGTGYIVSLELWRVYKTINSGNNWTFQTALPDCYNAECIFFIDVNTGWVSGDCGQMFSTTNGGLNWYQQNTQTNHFLNSVFFVNYNTGWSVGALGIIIHTTNGGEILGIKSVNNKLPFDFELYQNYPNPFNPLTVIEFDIAKTGSVTLTVYDILGREITRLIDEELKAGTYKVNFDGSEQSSGLYFYTLQTENYKETKKMVLVK